MEQSKLIELYIGNNLLTDIQEFFKNKTLSKLLILDISGNPFANINRKKIRESLLINLKKLKVLDGQTIDSMDKKQANEHVTALMTLDLLH